MFVASTRLWSAFVNNAHVVVPACHALLASLHTLCVSLLGLDDAGARLAEVDEFEALFLKCAAFNVLRMQQPSPPVKGMPWEQVFCLERVR